MDEPFRPDFMAMLENLPEGVSVTDSGGTILWANPYALDHLYCGNLEEVMGRTVVSFLVENERARAEVALRELRDTDLDLGRSRRFDDHPAHWTWQRLDGKTVVIEGHTRKIRAAGTKFYFLGAFHPVFVAGSDEETIDMTVSALISEVADLRRAIGLLVGQQSDVQGQLGGIHAEIANLWDTIISQSAIGLARRRIDVENGDVENGENGDPDAKGGGPSPSS